MTDIEREEIAIAILRAIDAKQSTRLLETLFDKDNYNKVYGEIINSDLYDFPNNLSEKGKVCVERGWVYTRRLLIQEQKDREREEKEKSRHDELVRISKEGNLSNKWIAIFTGLSMVFSVVWGALNTCGVCRTPNGGNSSSIQTMNKVPPAHNTYDSTPSAEKEEVPTLSQTHETIVEPADSLQQ